MRTLQHISYKKHVFISVNEHLHNDGLSSVDSLCDDIFLMLKSFVQANDLTQDIILTKTGCLGQCTNGGATIVIYPDMKWFIGASHENLDEIQEYIMK